MGRSTVSKIVHRVCKAIVDILTPLEMPAPTTEMWLHNAREFWEKWNFPNCTCAADGKHVTMFCPANSGSLYYNYKHRFSIVLMALVDANYRFVVVDIGAYGKNSDGGIWRRSQMGQRFAEGTMNMPPPANLPGSDLVANHAIVADEAFPLKDYILRPYPGVQSRADSTKRAYNYRQARARRIVENAFGILSQRWRMFLRALPLQPDSARLVVMASILLHNFLTPTTFIMDPRVNTRNGTFQPIPRPQQRRTEAQELQSAINNRDTIRQYLSDHPIISNNIIR